MTLSRILGHAGLLALLLVAAPLAAQEPQPPADSAQGGPPAAPTELVFEREVYTYPTYERRNPFRPLVGAQGSGPRFEQVRLRGIIWSADPQRSVALFGMAGQQAQPDTSGIPTTRRLRVGESWGNMRVTEIQKERVVVSVEEFGLSEQKVLELTRQRRGGGRQ
jgi:hypothetical protein